MNLAAVAATLNRDDVRSTVMKDGAFFDTFLGIALGMYFTTGDRFYQFHESIMERLTFDEKLRAIEKIPFKRPYKSVAALPVIRQVQQVRNLVAHEYYIFHGHPKLKKAQWLGLFSEYPASYRKPVMLARQRILRLTGTKEFLEMYELGGAKQSTRKGDTPEPKGDGQGGN
jgi:hypothetical protein